MRASPTLLARLSRGMLLLLAPAGASLAHAQPPGSGSASTYPGREVRFIVPFPPGGGNDVVGRIIAAKLQQALGREFIVDNRGEGGGTAGTAMAARAAPDGHTLLINNISLAVNATLIPKLPYDTQRDLAPISIVGRQPSVLLVHGGIAARSVRELLALARRQPGGLIYGSGGTGSSAHLATERLQQASGTRMTHVPYKGLAQAVADLSAGRVDMVLSTASTALPLMNGGKLRALAVTTAQRSALFPQLPTMMEAGLPGYEVSTWYAIFAPARTPARIIARLNSELAKIAADGEVRSRFAAQGLETLATTPAQARDHVRSEIAKWAKVVRAAGIGQQ